MLSGQVRKKNYVYTLTKSMMLKKNIFFLDETYFNNNEYQ